MSRLKANRDEGFGREGRRKTKLLLPQGFPAFVFPTPVPSPRHSPVAASRPVLLLKYEPSITPKPLILLTCSPNVIRVSCFIKFLSMNILKNSPRLFSSMEGVFFRYKIFNLSSDKDKIQFMVFVLLNFKFVYEFKI